MTFTTRITAFLLTGLLLAGFASAQDKKAPSSAEKSFSGYIVDMNCGTMIGKKDKEKAMEMGKKHSVACALDEACMASGYGLVHEGKVLPLDEAGNALAVKYLKGLTKKNDVYVTVSATLDAEVLHVSQISDEKTSIGKKG